MALELQRGRGAGPLYLGFLLSASTLFLVSLDFRDVADKGTLRREQKDYDGIELMSFFPDPGSSHRAKAGQKSPCTVAIHRA